MYLQNKIITYKNHVLITNQFTMLIIIILMYLQNQFTRIIIISLEDFKRHKYYITNQFDSCLLRAYSILWMWTSIHECLETLFSIYICTNIYILK